MMLIRRFSACSPHEVAFRFKRQSKEEVVTVDSSLKVGQSVEIIEGPFRGLEALVTRLLPARERIRVLFDFLGRSVEMEVSTAKVLAA
jgi:transcriptional antiterminator RfaH